jgi:hypothetical protein
MDDEPGQLADRLHITPPAYSIWLDMDLWTVAEAAPLLAGVCPLVCAGSGTNYERSRANYWLALLMRAMSAGRFDIRLVPDPLGRVPTQEALFPRAVVEWAMGKGGDLPAELVEAFSSTSSEADEVIIARAQALYDEILRSEAAGGGPQALGTGSRARGERAEATNLQTLGAMVLAFASRPGGKFGSADNPILDKIREEIQSAVVDADGHLPHGFADSTINARLSLALRSIRGVLGEQGQVEEGE